MATDPFNSTLDPTRKPATATVDRRYRQPAVIPDNIPDDVEVVESETPQPVPQPVRRPRSFAPPDPSAEPETGTTGGYIPKQAGTWDGKPITTADLSGDRATRMEQIRQETERRARLQFEKERPFAPSGEFKGPTTRAIRDASIEGEQAYGDLQQQRRQQIADRREQMRFDQKTRNATKEEQFRSTGQQFYIDPFGEIKPVIEAGTNRPLFSTTPKTLTKHPKTGEPVMEMRDKYGQRQYSRPKLVASDDPMDDRLYYDVGDGESVPAMTIEEAANHPDVSVAVRGKAARKRKMVAERNAATAEMEVKAGAIAMEFNSAQAMAAALKQNINNLEAQGGSPEEIARLTDESFALEERIKSGGDLFLQNLIAQKALATEKIKTKYDAHLLTRDEMSTRLIAEGKDPAKDPVFQDNERALAIFTQGLQQAERDEARIARLMQPVAKGPAVEQPPEGSFAGDVWSSFGSGAGALVKMVGDIYGLASGNMDNATSEYGKFVQDYWNKGKSKDILQLEKQRKADIDGTPSELGKALAYVKHTVSSPRLLSSALAEQVPMFVPGGGIGAVTRAGAAKILLRKALTDAAKMKAAQTATKIGVATALGAGAAMQGADVGGDQYVRLAEILSRMPEEKVKNLPEIKELMSDGDTTLDEAKLALLISKARKTGLVAGAISLAAQGLPNVMGLPTIEKLLVGGKTGGFAGSKLLNATVSGAAEALSEGIEEGEGQRASNIIAQSVDPTIKSTEGVGSAYGQSALVAGIPGAGAGFIQTKRESGPPDGGATQETQPTPPPAEGAATPSQNFPTADQTEAERAQAELEAALVENQAAAEMATAQGETVPAAETAPVDIGPRDETVSTGTGVPTEKEQAILTEQQRLVDEHLAQQQAPVEPVPVGQIQEPASPGAPEAQPVAIPAPEAQQPTQTEETSNAATQGQQPANNQPEYPGTAQGTAVQENRPEVRQAEGEQAGGGNRPVGSETGAAPVVRPEVEQFTPPYRPREGGGYSAIILSDGTAVIGGRNHPETIKKGQELGLITDQNLPSAKAGFVRPDGTGFDVSDGKPIAIKKTQWLDKISPPAPKRTIEQVKAERAQKGLGAAAKQATPEKLEGEKINREWTAFSDESKSLGVPRAEMPQVKAEHRGALTNFLKGRGITSEEAEVLPGELKPTQAEYSQAKVDKARKFEGGDRAILVSSDGHVLDGHHQWMAKLTDSPKEKMRVIRLNAPIKDLIAQVKEFPSAEVAKGAIAAAPARTLESVKEARAKQAAPSTPVAPAVSPASESTLGDQPVKLELRRSKTGEMVEVEMSAKQAESRVQKHIDTLTQIRNCLEGIAA